ncbi:hypothetical protein FSP39_007394 [Pinctada imbricata]|uniref:ABC transporter domain-containing protein n=1 Tax=Pinctada imbricata TaxID=66713 RepID=A0AA89C5I2_PINIB|nr:hypothetical protein FSP39_007394 [Pinctada imbricata]
MPIQSGEITLNDKPISKRMRRRICYVLQQDIFFPSLTLRDTLHFAAHIRLPEKYSKKQKEEILRGIVADLELEKCLDTPVGGMGMPGLSGGEKKRANIACEILTDPLLILLDEPTTGLDSSMAYNLVQIMQKYAVQHNKIIVSTIHQPSTKLFYQFDQLLLLCDGQMAYYGQTDKVINYFESINVPVSPGFNPADFILEKMRAEDEVKNHIIEAATEMRDYDDWPIKRSMFDNWNEAESPSMLKPLQTKKSNPIFSFSKSATKTFEDESDGIHASLMDLDVVDSSETYDGGQKWPTGFLMQYKHLTIRAFKLSRPQILDVTKLVQNVVICAIFSLIWFQLPRSEDTLRDRMGAIFFIAAHWGFTPLFESVAAFPMERGVIAKERLAGWYRLSAYYLAKMTSELPLILFQPLLFVGVAYWVIGLSGTAAYFATLGTVFIHTIAGQSIGLFIGLLHKEMRSVITICICIQMAIMLLGGLFTRNIPFWLDWMKYLSFLWYAFHGLLYLEFKDGPPLQCASILNSSAFLACNEGNQTLEVSSDLVLDYLQVRWEYWQYLLPLISFIIVFRFLGYAVLRFYEKPGK